MRRHPNLAPPGTLLHTIELTRIDDKTQTDNKHNGEISFWEYLFAINDFGMLGRRCNRRRIIKNGK